ncbi:MAG: hypothetical protein KIT60_26910 [Burkholderiaceae bacterium]|nr:hypothetical protein [Burkholderiaceae bacterium]
MKSLPRLQPLNPKQPDGTDSVVLAVYAPFGSDAVLSRYPDGQAGIPIQRQVLVKALQRVAREGVHVSALIDLYDDDSYLVEIPALQPKAMRITSVWKQDMTSPRALAGFLRRTHALNPCAAIALALEGHGAGYLPEVDAANLTPEQTTSNGDYEWTFGQDEVRLNPAPGSPALPVFSSVLPVFSSVLPAVDLPLSTSGLAAGLRLSQRQGVPKPAVIHFNNCFNMSVEHLHAVAPHADYATGYCNYNFFSSGETYPAVFRRLRTAGLATREALAQWFADENARPLQLKGNHPTIGGVVRLGRMREIVQCIDVLAAALVTALRPANAADRPAVLAKVQAAVEAAQKYDTVPGFALSVPDQVSDVGDLAAELLKHDFGAVPVHAAATALGNALKGVKRYGDVGSPWMDTAQPWDFSDPSLAMNIFLPDPERKGVWDWRSPFYMASKQPAGSPNREAQPIDFLTGTRWIDFIDEYHRNVNTFALLPALAPKFPVFNRKFDPNNPGGGSGQGKPGGPANPGGSSGSPNPDKPAC